jgi:AcrR family transcriptional regulator
LETAAVSSPRTRLEADARQEQIVAAAQRLFALQPYESVSIGQIAEAVGTTRTNIYHHFKSKRDLFLEVIERFSRIPADLDFTGPDGGPLERRVAWVLWRWLEAVERNREMFMTMLHASLSTDPQVSGALTDSMRAWEDRLLAILGLQAGVPAYQAMVRAYQAMVSEATVSWLKHQAMTKEQVHAMLTECLLALARSAAGPETRRPVR